MIQKLEHFLEHAATLEVFVRYLAQTSFSELNCAQVKL